MTELLSSWVQSANSADTDFPLNNLPYGIFSTPEIDPRCGVAIGDQILDLRGLREVGLIDFGDTLLGSDWNAFMALGKSSWATLRRRLTEILAEGSPDHQSAEPHLVPQAGAKLHLPIRVAEFTDFYAGKNHAMNVGVMLRGPENALPPNWLHIPIGYNGRASSVVVSGTDVRRPWGQLRPKGTDIPYFGPSKRFDMELEMGAIVGVPSSGPITVSQADENIFGYVILNDWSARDIQGWEYQPLGPFQAKATATSISPWIITKEALEPFRCNTPDREIELLDYLKEDSPMLYNIELSAHLAPEGKSASKVASTNYNVMYYSFAQQLAHHTTSGCPMRTGDLLGSGTISGTEKDSFGSLLELSWGGQEPFELRSGETRSFIEDGDTLILEGAAQGNGYKIGFGQCVGKILPALADPFQQKS